MIKLPSWRIPIDDKRRKCNFFDEKTEWCNGKDSYCDGWCTA